jgi:hypothetical protein
MLALLYWGYNLNFPRKISFQIDEFSDGTPIASPNSDLINWKLMLMKLGSHKQLWVTQIGILGKKLTEKIPDVTLAFKTCQLKWKKLRNKNF